MNINSAFPSAYLKAADLPASGVLYTMTSVDMESVGKEKVEKPVLYFAESEKGLVLNKVNSTTITKLFGEETSEWAGHQIVLYATPVQFGAEEVIGIRVRAPRTAAKPATAPAPAQKTFTPPPPDEPSDEELTAAPF